MYHTRRQRWPIGPITGRQKSITQENSSRSLESVSLESVSSEILSRSFPGALASLEDHHWKIITEWSSLGAHHWAHITGRSLLGDEERSSLEALSGITAKKRALLLSKKVAAERTAFVAHGFLPISLTNRIKGELKKTNSWLDHLIKKVSWSKLSSV